MRQYEVGEAFVAAVEREAGPRAIDAAWRGPEYLPTLAELQRPARAGSPGSTRMTARPQPARCDPLAPCRERFAADSTSLAAPVVVGCSGGADSVALLALAADAGLAPVAVHVDHGLRAEQRRTTRDTCAALADASRCARSHARAVDDRARGEPRSARARRAVRRARSARASSTAPTVVLVGHTADDQAETVLLNLLRGAAGAGLAGMAARRGRWSARCSGSAAPRRARSATRSALAVVDDPMNDDRAFRRVAVRHEVLPLLDGVAGRDLVPVLARQAEVLRAESRVPRRARRARRGRAATGRAGVARSPRSRRRSPAAPCGSWLGAPPPSLAEVERVLAVAAARRVAAPSSRGGRAVRRSRRAARARAAASVRRRGRA